MVYVLIHAQIVRQPRGSFVAAVSAGSSRGVPRADHVSVMHRGRVTGMA